MQLKEGKRYLRGDGRITDPLVKNNEPCDKWRYPYMDERHRNTYTESGRYTIYTKRIDMDIVSEAVQLDYGLQYVTRCRETTGVMKLNPDAAIKHPYVCGLTGRKYTEYGECDTGNPNHNIVARVGQQREQEPQPNAKYEVDIVTMSRAEYDRLRAIEAAFQEVYEEAKALLAQKK